MKRKTVLLLLSLFFSLYVWAESQLTFIDKRIINVGEVETGTLVNKKIRIKNDGDTPLIIKNSIKSCNCTAARFSREVLNPGETGTVEVEISTENKQGTNVVTVTLVANTEQQEHVIRISMNVVKKQVTELHKKEDSF